MDIAGPKFRIGNVKRQAGERLVAGDRFRMVADAATSAAIRRSRPCASRRCPGSSVAGTEVAFDDGKMGGVVEDSRKGSVLVRVTQTQRKGFKMKPERGLTFPRAELHLDPLTAVDLTDLDFVARYADLIGYSFVQAPTTSPTCRTNWRSVVPIGDVSASSPRSRPRRP